MTYLLDSNIISYFYNDKSLFFESIHSKIISLTDKDEILVSVLSIYEQEYGYANAPNEKKIIIRSRILAMEKDFSITPLPNEGAAIFGELKNDIRQYWLTQKFNEADQESMKRHNSRCYACQYCYCERCHPSEC